MRRNAWKKKNRPVVRLTIRPLRSPSRSPLRDLRGTIAILLGLRQMILANYFLTESSAKHLSDGMQGAKDSLMGTQSQILRRIQEDSYAILGKGFRVLSVFDLDSTLFDVSPRIQQIIQDFGDHPELRLDPAALQLLRSAKFERRDWGIRDALERTGFHLQRPDLAPVIERFWAERFFSEDYLHFDQPLPGALEFVRTLYEAGCEVAYLTGRDEAGMRDGTMKVLQACGFPVDSHRAQVSLKPLREISDETFKEDWFASIAKHQYERIWFFENEPLNINRIRSGHPEVEVIFVDTTHSRQASVPVDLAKIGSFLMTED